MTHTEAGTYPDTATATGKDNEGNTATGSDSARSTVTDVKPTVDITKSATPSKLPWPGGTFTFTLTIKNTSIEPVTITALTDTNINPVPGGLVGKTLAAGETKTVTYTSATSPRLKPMRRSTRTPPRSRSGTTRTTPPLTPRPRRSR